MKLRYIFTVATTPQEVPDNPLEQRAWVEEIVKKLQNFCHADRVGLIAVEVPEFEIGDDPEKNGEEKESVKH